MPGAGSLACRPVAAGLLARGCAAAWPRLPGRRGDGQPLSASGSGFISSPGESRAGQGLWMTPLVLAALDFVLSSPVPFHRWHASQGLPPSPERASVTQPLGVGGSAADPKGRVRISECPQAAPSMQGDGVAPQGLTAEWRLPATRFAPRQRQRAGQAPAMWGASRPRLVRAEPARGPVPGRCVPCSGRAGDGGGGPWEVRPGCCVSLSRPPEQPWWLEGDSGLQRSPDVTVTSLKSRYQNGVCSVASGGGTQGSEVPQVRPDLGDSAERMREGGGGGGHQGCPSPRRPAGGRPEVEVELGWKITLSATRATLFP